MEQDVQQYIQQEVAKQIKDQNRLNAGGMLFDPNTGLATQGKNVYGSFGDKVLHNMFRLFPTDQTIASGVINTTSSSMLVYTQSSASSDDLDTINPGSLVYAGEELIMLRAGDGGDTVVVKNGTGNIICAGDFSLDSVNDAIWLRWDLLQQKWIEAGRYDSDEKPGLVSKHIDILPYVPNTTAGGAWSISADANQLFAFVWLSSGAQNDSSDYQIYLQAGTYTITLIHTKDSNRGIYTFYLDDVTGTAGTTSVGTIDGYNAALQNNNKDSITSIAVASGGNKTIRVKMATKNAASSNYYAAISLLTLIRTSAP